MNEKSHLLSPSIGGAVGEELFHVNNGTVNVERRAQHQQNDGGQATYTETVVSLMKTCMGTGCLALAYATKEAGLILFCSGTLVLGLWNVVSADRLVRCLEYIPSTTTTAVIPTNRGRDHATTVTRSKSLEDQVEKVKRQIRHHEQQHTILNYDLVGPPHGTSTIGRVAWYSFGINGLYVLDIMLAILLMGIIVSYVAAVTSFLDDTPFSINLIVNTIIASAIMWFLSLVPDMSYLSKASAIGLLILFLSFVVVAGYGIQDYDIDESRNDVGLNLLPASVLSTSHWFGIAAFGFGFVPLTYNFHDSMKEGHRFVSATACAASGVGVSYIVLGVGLSILFPAVSSDVLHEIPQTGILPSLTRFAMAWMILVSAPLLVVPCGELFEGRLGLAHSARHRAAIRLGVVVVSAFVTLQFPEFVDVLAFVGCLCVSTVSFCIPPILHLKLVTTQQQVRFNTKAEWQQVALDIFLICVGAIATVVSTISLILQ